MSRLVLDTNILVGVVREAPFLAEAERRVDLFGADTSAIVSVASLGEIWSLAYQFGWGQKKRGKLTKVLSGLPAAGISPEVVDRYAEIDAFSQGKLPARPLKMSARNMGKNDLWIAATASVTGYTLVTADGDFDHLDGEFIDLVYIDPTSS